MSFLDDLAALLPAGITLEDLKALAPYADWRSSPQQAVAAALAACGRFDGDDYLARYPDVAESGMDPIQHFAYFGIGENRRLRLRAPRPILLPAQLEESGNAAILKAASLSAPPTFSVIITLYKRKNYLAEQYRAIIAQSPLEIIYIINENHIAPEFVRKATSSSVKIVHSQINTLYSRFALAYIARGEYVCVLDDDIIPGSRWFANAIRASRAWNAMAVASGRLYNPAGRLGFFTIAVPYASQNPLEDVSCAETDILCDWGCNAYLFRRDWCGYLTGQMRYNDALKTYDDMQSAISLYMLGGIRCVAPMQPEWDASLRASIKQEYGNDDNALWRNSPDHFKDREAFISSQMKNGFAPVEKRSGATRFHIIVPFGERAALQRCILSIAGQIYENFTCTLIDDCGDGRDSADYFSRLGLDPGRFRYLRSKKKLWPLRSREIATDLLDASAGDVIVHLDGDDWLAHSHVLQELNKIYRNGDALATYGNAVATTDPWKKSFDSWTPIWMSRSWNVAQNRPDEAPKEYRELAPEDLKDGWAAAPCSPMHLRSFRYSRWLLLDRKTFRHNNGTSLRNCTDVAVMIPLLENCDPQSIVFAPDINYVYQNAKNTFHAKKIVSEEEQKEARKRIMAGGVAQNRKNLAARLVGSVSASIDDFRGEIDLLFDFAPAAPWVGEQRPNTESAIITVITPDYLPEAILSLASYRRNLEAECAACAFICTHDKAIQNACEAILDRFGIKALYPETLVHSRKKAEELEKKYSLGSNEFRWALKAALLEEILADKWEAALFLDPDMYTVNGIEDVHAAICSHELSVFPHFRSPDQDHMRHLLYSDGFFNGGMLGATRGALKQLARLYGRCLRETVIDYGRDRYVDQKYYDNFILECDDLYINKDKGIDYNPWNNESAQGCVSPSQRSFLLDSGFFARIWHMNTTMLARGIDRGSPEYTLCRPVIAIYLLSHVHIQLLIAIASASRDKQGAKILLEKRMEDVSAKLAALSASIDLKPAKDLWNATGAEGSGNINKLLDAWLAMASDSICFDNFALYADLLLRMFPASAKAGEIAKSLRCLDLRYRAEKITPDAQNRDTYKTSPWRNTDIIIGRRLASLKKSGLTW